MGKKNLLTAYESVEEVPPSRTMLRRHASQRIRWIVAVILVASTISGVCCQDDDSLKGVVGSAIDVPYLERTDDCGSVHSVRWYFNNNRFYVYSGSSTALPPPERFEFRANDTPPVLHISSVHLSDEGTYRCDVTYNTLVPGCPTSRSTHLQTLAKPNSPEIYLGLPDGEVIGGEGSPVTGTTLGPFHENEQVRLLCSSNGGKPAAQVTWWNGSQSLGGFFTEKQENDGTGVGTNDLRLKISRSDLLARYDCQVTHETLGDEPLVTWIQIDVHVPPSDLVLEGDGEADEGEEVTLTCSSKGARPAAKIVWYNGSEPLGIQPDVTIAPESGSNTFSSTSTLTFVASRYDDEENIVCQAINEALEDGRGSPLKQQKTLAIYYAPVVRLSSPGHGDHLELNEGATLRLECAFEANPAANVTDVTWYRNSVVLHQGISESDENGGGGNDEENGEDVGNGNDKEEGSQQSSDKDGRFLLVLTKINRRQSGDYSCAVENNVGRGVTENNVNVSILYAPEVRLLISPTTAIEHLTNVTLICEVEEANPSVVTRVRWFRDSQLIDESEESMKVLERVNRFDHSNYSCQAENKVGWGPVAEPELLDVIYTPGRARITHRPPLIIKGQPVLIMCEFDDLGNPPATEFIWRRGDLLISAVSASNWSTSAADLTTQDEYSCNARNAAGEGIEATAKIDVNAPPSLINGLLNSTGDLETAKDISLTCQVECEPRCSIDWFKNGELLTVDRSKNGDDALEETLEEDEADGDAHRNVEDNGEEEEDLQSPYSVKVSYLQPNYKDMYFSSVVSTLRWNVSAWPNKRLDRILDVANYTCRSLPNLAGIGVSSTTRFHVEYPPENISLSTYEIEIEEGQVVPSPITCKADGKPELTYFWTFDGKPVSGTNELKLNFEATREKSGVFTCIASNTHGNLSAKVNLNVQYKPECKLHASIEEDGSTLLTCEVVANPEDVDFVWLVNNETVRDGVLTRGLVSRLNVVGGGGKYRCSVNNSLGHVEEACVIELQGPEGALIAGFSDNRIIIIVVVVAAIILISIIVLIIVILVMKRRRATGKYCNPMELDQRESPEGHSQTDSTKTTKSGRKAGVVTFKRVEPPDSGLDVGQYETDENGVAKLPRNQQGPPGEGDRAFYENLPFHGLQPAPNKAPATNHPANADSSLSSAQLPQPKLTRLYPHPHLPVTSSPLTLQQQQTYQSDGGGGGSVGSLGIPTREGVVYADLALSAVPGSVHSVVNRRDRPTEYAPFKPLLPDLEYADVDFTSANQGQQQLPKEIPKDELPPVINETPASDITTVPEVEEEEEVEEERPDDDQQQPEPEEQQLLQPERPPRANKTVLNNNHAS